MQHTRGNAIPQSHKPSAATKNKIGYKQHYFITSFFGNVTHKHTLSIFIKHIPLPAKLKSSLSERIQYLSPYHHCHFKLSTLPSSFWPHHIFLCYHLYCYSYRSSHHIL